MDSNSIKAYQKHVLYVNKSLSKYRVDKTQDDEPIILIRQSI